MKERPILFSAPMVRAILDGRKTVTRRVVKPQPYVDAQGNACWNGSNFGQDANGPHIKMLASPLPSSKTGRVHCPYGKPGDRLWVRETWRTDESLNDKAPRAFSGWPVRYEADGAVLRHGACFGNANWKTRVSIHMPRWASRILLEITAVRVERLQDISVADAMAEGVIEVAPHLRGLGPCMEWRYAYEDLWRSINGAGSWDENPWVWVIEFKRVSA